jgi:hypothetical protein
MKRNRPVQHLIDLVNCGTEYTGSQELSNLLKINSIFCERLEQLAQAGPPGYSGSLLVLGGTERHLIGLTARRL